MCKHSKWSSGYPCRGDGYPDFMQGQYLPGDEPGWICEKTDDFCCSEECPEGEEYYDENCELELPDDYYD